MIHFLNQSSTGEKAQDMAGAIEEGMFCILLLLIVSRALLKALMISVTNLNPSKGAI
jgi:hypothetical protein